MTSPRELAKSLCASFFKDDNGQPFQLTDGQADIWNTIVLRKHLRNQLMTPTQYGKQCSHDTPVLTTRGWSTHGQLKPGDHVFNHYGQPVKVEGLSDESEATLEIEFSNGEKIKCHPRHEWVVKDANANRRGKDWQNIETRFLKDNLHRRWHIPFIEPIEHKPQDLPLDPYFVGAWLGDGSSSKPCITGHKDDLDVIARIPYGTSSICVHNTTGIVTYYFSHQNIMVRLRELGLDNNKHIPDVYKYGTVHDRLELLAGLIDTDGHVNKGSREKGWRNGRVYFTNINKRLVDDVAEIVESLGLRTTIVEQEAIMSTSGIQGKHKVYVLGFQPYIAIPTALPRKKIDGLGRKRHITIKAIRDIEPVKGRCIQVEGGVYLAGRKLIPTHNSEVISMAVLLRAITYKEDWLILSGDTNKTQIIMKKAIGHLFDNKALESQIDLSNVPNLEKLKHERSQSRITFIGGGQIRILTADSRNSKKVKESLAGQGGRNIVEDEAALIPDDLQAMVMRMLGGFKDAFLLKIGNPFYRNHFLKTWQADHYHKIHIDYHQALAEGRFSEEFIEEMRTQPFFDVLYEVKFPDTFDTTIDGYRRLISDDQLEAAFIDQPVREGQPYMGVDIAGTGTDRSCYVLRWDNTLEIIESNNISDIMQQVPLIEQFSEQYGIAPQDVAIDTGGLGQGVGDRLHEKDFFSNNIMFGGRAPDPTKYKNMRAYMYYELSQWIKNGGRLVRDDRWYELLSVNYKTDSERKFIIQPKEDIKKIMREHGSDFTSPDVADAAALTFADNSMMLTEDDFEWI